MEMKICIAGCNGRMGRLVIARVLDTESCILTGGSEQRGSPAIGRDIATLIGRPPIGHLVGHEPILLFHEADVVIDFSSPSATVTHANAAASTGTALVVGTTGLEQEQLTALSTAAKKVPILYSPNMSLTMNVMFSLVEKVSRVLDESYDIEILEVHHRDKMDAPSGSALELGRAAALGRGTTLQGILQRQGHIGKRLQSHIGFAAVRGGDVVGEHTVLFISNGERIELTHKVSAREIFAGGAIRAAFWLATRSPGFYSMQDVIGMRTQKEK